MQLWRVHLEQAIATAVGQVACRYGPERIILFGSAARGDLNEDSDIDLLIIKDTQRPFFRRIDDVLAVLDVDAPVEPLVYTPEEFKRLLDEERDFIQTVLAEGRVVYEQRA